MNWFTKILPGIKKKDTPENAASIPEGVWEKCASCQTVLYVEQLKTNGWVCMSCDHHHRLTAPRRAIALFDASPPPQEIGGDVRPMDFLNFSGDGDSYQSRIKRSQDGDARREAAAVYVGQIEKREAVVVIFDFQFMGGSMGSVAGERFVRGVEEAMARQAPFVSIAASGGARMQEGMTSLLQMAKTTSALSALAQQRLPHISVLTDPTTGGVAASFALVGDVIIAEPGALVGFAGPRVIRETVREELPEGFQRSEFLLEHGAVDMIVDRRELRNVLSKLFAMLAPARRVPTKSSDSAVA